MGPQGEARWLRSLPIAKAISLRAFTTIRVTRWSSAAISVNASMIGHFSLIPLASKRLE